MLEDVLTGMAWDGRLGKTPWDDLLSSQSEFFCLKKKTDADIITIDHHFFRTITNQTQIIHNNTLLCKVATLGSFAQPFLMAVTAKPAASHRRWGLNSPWRNLWVGLERWIWKRWSTKNICKLRQRQDQFHILPHRVTWLRKTHGKPMIASYDRMAAELEPQPGALKDAKISNTTAKVLQSVARLNQEPSTKRTSWSAAQDAQSESSKSKVLKVPKNTFFSATYLFLFLHIISYNNYINIIFMWCAHKHTCILCHIFHLD